MAVRNRKGFTLVEMLIVVALVAVLAAISIPVFSGQLEKSRETTDIANIRSAYSEVIVAYMTGDEELYTAEDPLKVPLVQLKSDWQSEDLGSTMNGMGSVTGVPQKNGTCCVYYDAEEQTGVFSFEGALPVTFTDLKNVTVTGSEFGKMMSVFTKDGVMDRHLSRGRITENVDGTDITFYAFGSRDAEIRGTIQARMREVGYSEEEIEGLFKPAVYCTAYLDENYRLVAYSYGKGGGSNWLYYSDGTRVESKGSLDERAKIAEHLAGKQ